MHTSRPSQSAFSLVELSIVLVILGLLVGGILAGQSLIRASELRAVSTEQQRYVTALGAFRDKYFALPGDFNQTGFGTTTWVNFGNGNGYVESADAGVDGDGNPNPAATNSEVSLFWIHLSAAGLIEGSYTYTQGVTHTIGTHKPASKLSGAGWSAYALGSSGLGSSGTVPAANTTYFPGTYGNPLFFGAGTSVGTPTGVIRAEEAWNIDTKMDDGAPGTGSVVTLETLTNCNSSATLYNLSNTSATACAFVMKTGF